MPSMKCFFFKCRGEHGAPESAFTISSSTFCKHRNVSHHLKGNERRCRRVNIFNYLLDLRQVIKFAVAILQLDSSYFQQTSPKYRKMFRSIYTGQFKIGKKRKALKS